MLCLKHTILSLGDPMTMIKRAYQPADLLRVGNFLMQHYLPHSRDGNWLQPAWDYMHSHPWLDEDSLDRIAVWEEDGEMVGVAHYESRLGEAFFEVHPRHTHLKAEMLCHAEEHFVGTSEDGLPYLNVYINDFDADFEAMAQERGYRLSESYHRPLAEMRIPEPFPAIDLPEGFLLQSLADENDLQKINRVLHRGFNHPGEAPDEDLPGRVKMQSNPHFRKDLTIVVKAPNGEFATFCGLWYVPQNRYGYVEPMATDPDYRRMGLGKAALLEGVRRCRDLGAEAVYVGSLQPFYQALGFEHVYTSRPWAKPAPEPHSQEKSDA